MKKVIDTNLNSAFYMIKNTYHQFMKRRSGRIINISSISGLMGNAGQANYAAAKAGMVGLTKSVAKELAGRGITCNAVAPGFIETDMTAVLSEKVKAAGRGPDPDEEDGQAGGRGGSGGLLGQRRGAIYHRPGAQRRRRTEYVIL